MEALQRGRQSDQFHQGLARTTQLVSTILDGRSRLAIQLRLGCTQHNLCNNQAIVIVCLAHRSSSAPSATGTANTAPRLLSCSVTAPQRSARSQRPRCCCDRLVNTEQLAITDHDGLDHLVTTWHLCSADGSRNNLDQSHEGLVGTSQLVSTIHDGRDHLANQLRLGCAQHKLCNNPGDRDRFARMWQLASTKHVQNSYHSFLDRLAIQLQLRSEVRVLNNRDGGRDRLVSTLQLASNNYDGRDRLASQWELGSTKRQL